MEEDFDEWNLLKKKIDNKKEVFCNTREIWWCSIGINIGSEENGKNHLFERPILITKVFNKNICRVIPLTSTVKDDKNHISISYLDRTGSAILSQMKTISTRRLSRKMCRLDKEQFEKIKAVIKNNV